MLRLIKFILTGDWHMHKWKHYRLENIMDGNEVAAYDHVRECEVCGKIKAFRT